MAADQPVADVLQRDILLQHGAELVTAGGFRQRSVAQDGKGIIGKRLHKGCSRGVAEACRAGGGDLCRGGNRGENGRCCCDEQRGGDGQTVETGGNHLKKGS